MDEAGQRQEDHRHGRRDEGDPGQDRAHPEVEDEQQREDEAKTHLHHPGEPLADRGPEVIGRAAKETEVHQWVGGTVLPPQEGHRGHHRDGQRAEDHRRGEGCGLGLGQAEDQPDDGEAAQGRAVSICR